MLQLGATGIEEEEDAIMELFIKSISCSLTGQSDLRESGCENGKWIELAQNRIL
jgi:hypothetical protein